MAEYTDMLGNPIAVGDVIVYPMQYRSTAATMHMAVVTHIYPVVPVHENAVVGWWPKDLARPEEARVPKPMVTHVVDGKKVYDPSKAYLIHGHKYGTEDYMYLRNVDRCVVVTDLIKETNGDFES